MGQYEFANNSSQNEQEALAAATATGFAEGQASVMDLYFDTVINSEYDPGGYKDLINGDVDFDVYDWDTFPWQITTQPDDWDESDNGVFQPDINYDWYANDPLYVQAGQVNDVDISTREGLQQAAEYIVRTSSIIMRGGFVDLDWREDKAALKEGEYDFKPVELDTSSVYTAPEEPVAIRALPDPQISDSVNNLRIRSGASMVESYNKRAEFEGVNQ